MPWPTIFANLAAGNQPLALFDAMFTQVAQMVAVPCSASGVNALTLSPIGSAPSFTSYQNFTSARFVATNNSTAAVVAQFGALASLPVYLADGVTQATTQIVSGNEYVLIFIQALNGGAGGFILEAAGVTVTSAVAGSALANLVNTNNAGTPNTQIDTTYDELVMNNPTGGAVRFTTQSFTTNAAVNGVVNGLDVGALANNTWYALWGISNGATAGGLLSLSFSNPTMPAGYSYKKRLGAFITDGTAHFLRVMQRGNTAQYIVGTNPLHTPQAATGVAGTYSGTTPTLVSLSVASQVPPSAKAVQVNANVTLGGGGPANVEIAPNTAWGGTNNGPAGNNCYPIWALGAALSTYSARIVLETLSTIAWASSAAGGTVGIAGWEDNLS